MYLLYLDESGNPDDPADRYFVLGGAAVFERTAYFLSQDLEEIQESHFPGVQPIEFHAAAIRSGKGFWRKVEREKRDRLLSDIAGVIEKSNNPGVVLFSAVIEKSDTMYGEEAVKKATEEICNRFDLFLMRRRRNENDTQRGLLVFDEGRYKTRSKLWVTGFRTLGTQWGILRNLSDIPYFAASSDTRLLQVADFIAHSVFLMYERKDNSLFKKLLPRFDNDGGVIHGLSHFAHDRDSCLCPACLSRRTPGEFGDWAS